MLTVKQIIPDRDPSLLEAASAYQALTAVLVHITSEAMSMPPLSEKHKILFDIASDISIARFQCKWLCEELAEEQRREHEEQNRLEEY